MDFIDEIKTIAARIPKLLEVVKTEEATKTSCVMPFIRALGYDIFDPTEVVPEFTADVGIKKGEKVDYAIMRDGKPIILIECKWSGTDLNKVHAAQLSRYFHVTETHFGILTNGIIYRFYSDLENDNKMDEKPFLEFNMLDFQDSEIDKLKQFTRTKFDLKSILDVAQELKYSVGIQQIFSKELIEPSDEFVKFFAKQIYSGKLVPSVKKQFSTIIRRTLRDYINEQINKRLTNALGGDKDVDETVNVLKEEEKKESDDKDDSSKSRIITTPEEIAGYEIIKSLLTGEIDLDRIVMRDTVNYCGILLDNNNRKPICRMWFNTSQWYLGLINENKKEEKIAIAGLHEISKYKDRIIAKIKHYEN